MVGGVADVYHVQTYGGVDRTRLWETADGSCDSQVTQVARAQNTLTHFRVCNGLNVSVLLVCWSILGKLVLPHFSVIKCCKQEVSAVF